MKGSVVKIVGEKGYGFIQGEDGKEYFFHRSSFNGFYDDLATDIATGSGRIPVTFNVVPSPRGPRAEEVTRLDGGI